MRQARRAGWSRRLGRGALLAALAVGAAVTTGAELRVPAAHAQTQGELSIARKNFNAGLQAEKARDWAKALGHYEKALAIKATPQLLLRAGICREELGKLAAALVTYERALEQARLQKLTKVVGVVEGRLEKLKPRVPTVVITLAQPNPDAQLTLDGAPVASTTLGEQLPIDPGDHVIEASAPGFLPTKQSLTATEGQQQQVTVTLKPDPAAGQGAGGSGAGGGGGGDTVAPSEPNYIPGAVLAGVGGAALVTGIVLVVLGQGKEGEVDDLCGGPDRLFCAEEDTLLIDSLLSDASTFRVSGFVVGGVGLAAAVAGAVLLILPPGGGDGAAGEAGMTLVPTVTPRQAGLSLIGRF